MFWAALSVQSVGKCHTVLAATKRRSSAAEHNGAALQVRAAGRGRAVRTAAEQRVL